MKKEGACNNFIKEHDSSNGIRQLSDRKDMHNNKTVDPIETNNILISIKSTTILC